MSPSRDTTWKLVKSAVPYMPDWAILRPLISDNYLVPRPESGGNNKTNTFANNKQIGGIK